MSRASDLTLFLIILQASIGFVDATGLFTSHYMGAPVSNNASYTISDLNTYTVNPDPSTWGELIMAAHWMVETLIIGVKIIFAVVFVFPTLVFVFNVPAILAAFLQVGVYYIYSIWYAQYKSGKGWKFYE